MRVLIDTDPGTDDALAIIMALNSSALDVLALTTVGGNASLSHTTRNALSILEFVGRADVPVVRGAARPLVGRFHYGYYYHGAGGLGVRLPKPMTRPLPVRASDHIVSLASALRGELIIVALGPLTNVARALIREPRLGGWLKKIVVMGGALQVSGNVTPHAEFNIYNDPRAARVVLESGVPLTLVGLDVTAQTVVHRSESPWLSARTRGAQLGSRILEGWFTSNLEDDRYDLCDPLAVAATVQPELLTYRSAEVTVETEDARRMGQTTPHFGTGHVEVATGVKTDEARKLIEGLLAS